MKPKIDVWRAWWACVLRSWELGLSGLLLGVGILLSLALLPELPHLAWGTLTGRFEATRTLFVCAAGIAVCILQWKWRSAIYPQLKHDASKKRAL